MLTLMIGRKKLYAKSVHRVKDVLIFEGQKPFSPFVSRYWIPVKAISYIGLEG